MKTQNESEKLMDSQQPNEEGVKYRGQFPSIQLHPHITYDELANDQLMLKSHYLTLIVYNYLETPKMQQFFGMSIQVQGELTLLKKPLHPNININTNNNYYNILQSQSLSTVQTTDKQYQYYLLYMVNDNLPLQQQDGSSKYMMERKSQMYYNSNNSKYQSLKPVITLLVSLADKVIVYELDKQKQSFIEKVFVQSISTQHKIKWQSKSHIDRPNRLVFIKQCYPDKRENKAKENDQSNKIKDQQRTNQRRFVERQANTLTATTSLLTLQFYSCLSQYTKHLQEEKKKYMQLCSLYPQRPDHPYVEQLITKHKCMKHISLAEIIEIYQQIVKFMSEGRNNQKDQSKKGEKYTVGEIFGKEKKISEIMNGEMSQLQKPWKIRYYIEKAYELQSSTSLYNTIQYQLFHPSTHSHTADFIRKQLRKYLTSPSSTSLLFSPHSLSDLQYTPAFSRQIPLSPESRQKLLWKLNRIQKYQQQLTQQRRICPSASENKLLYELKDDEIFNWIGKYKNWWMEHSMSHLKLFFNKIANEKDHKAIQQFKQECYKMTQKLNKLDLKSYDSPRQAMVKDISLEINTFVDYHFEVLETRKLAGIKFLYHQIKYTLKHKQKVRNKLLLFGLMVILALMQRNVIAGITIATMAIIVLAIRL